MNLQVLEELLYLTKKNKIPNDITIKLLKTSRLKNEEKEVYALKKLLNGFHSISLLKLFCNYYEWGILNLKELDTNLSFCSFCLEYHPNIAFNPIYKDKLILLYEFYTRIDYQIPMIKEFITSATFFETKKEEISFYLQVYFYVKSTCENGKSSFMSYQSGIGSILENRTIQYELRKVFFDLTNSNYIFFTNQFWQLIWHRLNNCNYGSAIWTSLYLREKIIISSPEALKFIMNDDNIVLLSLCKDFFLSPSFTENNMLLINSLKKQEEKEQQIKLLSNINTKKEKKKIKINENDFTKKLYTGYLNEVCSLEEITRELKKIQKRNMNI